MRPREENMAEERFKNIEMKVYERWHHWKGHQSPPSSQFSESCYCLNDKDSSHIVEIESTIIL